MSGRWSILELWGRIRLVLYIYILIRRVGLLVWPLDWLAVRRLLLLRVDSEGVLLSEVLLSHLSLLLLVSIILIIVSLALLPHVHPILVLRHE